MHTSGSCLCGAIKYDLDAQIQKIGHCHCSMCRKAHGAAFASFVNVPAEAFRLLEGEDSLGAYHSSEQVTRTFCKQCGSSLQFIDRRAKHIGVAAGTLDSALPRTEQYHLYVDSKADWYNLDDRLPKHNGDPDL
ncbi:GFA family protein [Pseudomonas matsuisoli]|uniref:CENP-V/GFA domain-containing protein n=1 Tax=Pseudomonas matsuisoli TaxID=1515666 RepID=A0A917PHS5_9PSED|nr:GFA family protein [Pseudomonas matsuisoli]GGJ78444.1 hypothetical protein GCM10009304_00420 [Pseudomonas matsuisoli]